VGDGEHLLNLTICLICWTYLLVKLIINSRSSFVVSNCSKKKKPGWAPHRVVRLGVVYSPKLLPRQRSHSGQKRATLEAI
jgi:hypothetical protein